MQSILGAGGPIGIDLAKELKNNGHNKAGNQVNDQESCQDRNPR